MIKKRTIIKNEKGVALLWALITIAVLLAITGSMANLMIKESRMSTGIDGSISAYAAAESGIERGSYLTTTGISYPYTLNNQQVDPADPTPTYSIYITKPMTDTFKIESIGKSGNTTRKIVKNVSTGSSARPYMMVYTAANPSLLGDPMTNIRTHPISILSNSLNDPTNPVTPISTSYSQEIELEILDPNSNFSVGFSGDVAGQLIMFNKKYDSTNGSRISITNGSVESTPVSWAVPDDTGTPPLRKRYRIKIAHVKNQATQVRVERYLAGDCSEVISLASADSYPMTNVRFDGGSNVVSWDINNGVTIGTVAKIGVMSVRPN